MRRQLLVWIVSLSALLAACSLVREGDEVRVTATPDVPAPSAPVVSALESDTGPYLSRTDLLNGVCFEFLLSAAGETWVWTTPEDLAAFYDRVDASELCRGTVARGAFDFATGALAGAISAATGCDAAHTVIELADAPASRVQTLRLQLVVEPGCGYELVEPVVVALPPPPGGVALQVQVLPPP